MLYGCDVCMCTYYSCQYRQSCQRHALHPGDYTDQAGGRPLYCGGREVRPGADEASEGGAEEGKWSVLQSLGNSPPSKRSFGFT